MAQILVQVSDALLGELERVAPAASRKRSRFIQLAIQKALMEIEDRRTRAVYAREHDDVVVADDAPWDEWKPNKRRRAVRK